MSKSFPTTTVAGVELPRLLIGCNWISGFSHQTPARDELIRRKHHTPESVADIFETFLNEGVNAVLGLFGTDEDLLDSVKLAQERTGQEVTILDTVVINVDDSPMARGHDPGAVGAYAGGDPVYG